MTEASTHIALPAPRGAGSIAFARLAAVLVCVIGEIVLAMWLHIIPGLEQILPGLAGTTANAVLGVIAAGLGLLCLTFRRLRLVAPASRTRVLRVDDQVDRAAQRPSKAFVAGHQVRLAEREEENLDEQLQWILEALGELPRPLTEGSGGESDRGL